MCRAMSLPLVFPSFGNSRVSLRMCRTVNRLSQRFHYPIVALDLNFDAANPAPDFEDELVTPTTRRAELLTIPVLGNKAMTSCARSAYTLYLACDRVGDCRIGAFRARRISRLSPAVISVLRDRVGGERIAAPLRLKNWRRSLDTP